MVHQAICVGRGRVPIPAMSMSTTATPTSRICLGRSGSGSEPIDPSGSGVVRPLRSVVGGQGVSVRARGAAGQGVNDDRNVPPNCWREPLEATPGLVLCRARPNASRRNRWPHAASARRASPIRRPRGVLCPGENLVSPAAWRRQPGPPRPRPRPGCGPGRAGPRLAAHPRASGRRRVGRLALPPHPAGLQSRGPHVAAPGRGRAARGARPSPRRRDGSCRVMSDREVLAAALDRLPYDQRVVMVLHFHLDLPLTEAASHPRHPRRDCQVPAPSRARGAADDARRRAGT